MRTFRNSASDQIITRLVKVACDLEGMWHNLSLWDNRPSWDRTPFYRVLEAKEHELWEAYTYRFLGLDQNVPADCLYYKWLFDPKWRSIAPNGPNFAYRIRFLLSEFDLPHLEINYRIDWRRVHLLFPSDTVYGSCDSFVGSIRYIPRLMEETLEDNTELDTLVPRYFGTTVRRETCLTN